MLKGNHDTSGISSCRFKAETLARQLTSRLWPCTWGVSTSPSRHKPEDEDEFFDAPPTPTEENGLVVSSFSQGNIDIFYDVSNSHAVNDLSCAETEHESPFSAFNGSTSSDPENSTEQDITGETSEDFNDSQALLSEFTSCKELSLSPDQEGQESKFVAFGSKISTTNRNEDRDPDKIIEKTEFLVRNISFETTILSDDPSHENMSLNNKIEDRFIETDFYCNGIMPSHKDSTETCTFRENLRFTERDFYFERNGVLSDNLINDKNVAQNKEIKTSDSLSQQVLFENSTHCDLIPSSQAIINSYHPQSDANLQYDVLLTNNETQDDILEVHITVKECDFSNVSTVNVKSLCEEKLENNSLKDSSISVSKPELFFASETSQDMVDVKMCVEQGLIQNNLILQEIDHNLKFNVENSMHSNSQNKSELSSNDIRNSQTDLNLTSLVENDIVRINLCAGDIDKGRNLNTQETDGFYEISLEGSETDITVQETNHMSRFHVTNIDSCLKNQESIMKPIFSSLSVTDELTENKDIYFSESQILISHPLQDDTENSSNIPSTDDQILATSTSLESLSQSAIPVCNQNNTTEEVIVNDTDACSVNNFKDRTDGSEQHGRHVTNLPANESPTDFNYVFQLDSRDQIPACDEGLKKEYPTIDIQPATPPAMSTKPQVVYEEDRPQLLRSTSLKTGKTPPGTPSKKKMVRFADVLGLDLESVRHIMTSDLPHIPASAYSHLYLRDQLPKSKHITVDGMLRLRSRPRDNFSPTFVAAPQRGTSGPNAFQLEFSIPGRSSDFMAKVQQLGICLENIVVSEQTVRCACRVMNWSYEKKVSARFTTDEWRSYSDIDAAYVPCSSDGQTDGFAFSMFLSPKQTRLWFALKLSVNGKEYWDNNGGSDYRLSYNGDANSSVPVETDSAWLNHFW